MSFWSDASPVVKGAIVVGILGLLYLGASFITKAFPPFGPKEETQQTRGLPGQ